MRQPNVMEQVFAACERAATTGSFADPLTGIDHDDQPVHVRIQGTMLTYCGRHIEDSTHLPPAEVTESSWCPDCVRIQDGT